MSSLASAETSNSPERSKKILVPKKSRGTLDTVGQDFNFNFPELDENDVMDGLENDVVTFYVQQVLRLGRKTHATLEVDMDKSVKMSSRHARTRRDGVATKA